MHFLSEKRIKLEKPLNDLDLFVLKFIRILEKHTEYVLISGYVSLLFGRTRSTEDVDVFIKPITKENFVQLYHELLEYDFECLNATSDNEVYSYLEEGLAIRFARKGETIPNMEVKVAKTPINLEVFRDILEVETEQGILRVSSLERQIAFKRYFLSSKKDLEDARYLESTFKEKINPEKIKKYKALIEKEYGKTQSFFE